MWQLKLISNSSCHCLPKTQNLANFGSKCLYSGLPNLTKKIPVEKKLQIQADKKVGRFLKYDLKFLPNVPPHMGSRWLKFHLWFSTPSIFYKFFYSIPILDIFVFIYKSQHFQTSIKPLLKNLLP